MVHGALAAVDPISQRSKPTRDELWTTTDIGRRLRITRSGAQQLAKSQRDFPLPIGKVGHYVMWWAPEVELWIQRRYAGTKPRGRHRRVLLHPVD